MKFLTAFAFVIFLAACGARSSDEDQVRALFASVESTAEKRDSSDVLEFVADGYRDTDGFDKTQLRNFLRAWFLAHPKPEAERVRLKVEFRRESGDWRLTRADRLER